MEQLRLALYACLGVLMVLIWQAWRGDHIETLAPQDRTGKSGSAIDGSAVEGKGLPVAAAAPQLGQDPKRNLISVQTDVLSVSLDSQGAQLRTLGLRLHTVGSGEVKTPFPLFVNNPARSFYVQSGLLDNARVFADGKIFSTPAENFELAPSADTLEVPFDWKDPAGPHVRIVYTFQRGSYVIGLRYEITNAGTSPWTGSPFTRLVRHPGADAKSSLFNPVSFQGGALYTAEGKFQKYSYKDIAKKPLSQVVTDGWVAMTEHYFTAALLPPDGTERTCFTEALQSDQYAIGCIAAPVIVAPGASAQYETRLYAGPKEQRQIGDVAPGLNLTVDYGLFTVIAQPLFWLLRTVHEYVNNWGLAIILVTLVIKLAFYKLSATSYRSMAHLRLVQPKMLELRERYKDDRAKLNEKMMELYRAEKVNPLGGCLPIVVQIPVFISLYWVLLESVELRQAPFMLWIHDLSTKDPYYVLPILMGVTMFLQQRMNPMPMEPMQQRVMMVLPLVFTVFFALFPAGLVLYWLVNNVLSIAQQWFITQRMQRVTAAPA